MNSITIHGHRGSRGTHPENTIPSFAEAYAAGARFVELDVHLTRDGEVIVFHDPELSAKLCRDFAGNPLTQPVPIRDLTSEDIRTYDCGSQPQSMLPEQRQFPGLRIPTLAELIAWKKTAAPELRLNVEIKTGSADPERLADAVTAVLRRGDCLDGTLIQSFEPAIVRAVRKREPDVRLSCLFERVTDFVQVARDCQAQVVAAHYFLFDASTVRLVQSAGLEALPWTVNDPGEWRRLIALNIQAIITDYPRKLAQYLTDESIPLG